ncbi:secretion-regulating guanine nucleotide exchange factor isoform X1 [Zootermopsis nevadensis]|uniref:Secretion-regulating guanine nucleotide exchange factor n=1 Tax=Zootermopsis nevadensis TaxID=136037 RepID=A0A067QY23_ZOONE|nr:secretion-regulating guanine nucleotide exchange factor isoform X1 [Zootermopsis nevadensis]KDR15370.1 Secretion-regulating guanine nucleotide exchange factor [Zootermopsis nevadensis]
MLYRTKWKRKNRKLRKWQYCENSISGNHAATETLGNIWKLRRGFCSNMKLLSWGANTYSQLGQGFKSEQCVLPGELEKEDSLDLSCITSIVGGGGHTLIVNKYGQVFACGSNTMGQLGLEMNTENLVFERIKLLDTYHIIQVACGWNSSLAVTKNGELLVWGSNAYCQLGLPKKKTPFTSIPLKIEVPYVKTVASGLRHSAILTTDGLVMVCGNGKNGQLGLTDNNGISVAEVEQPQEIPGVTDVCSIACGQQHTVVMTCSRRIFVWGNNKHGQLGVDPSLHAAIFTPKEIFIPQRPDAGCILLSGWTHTAILTVDGKIINWGRNTYGQLGSHEYQRPLFWKPQVMDNVKNVKQLAVGSEHNIAVLDTGRIVSWGWNEHGNCGTGTDENVQVPTSVGMDIKQTALIVGTGAGHSFALISE